MRVCSCRLGVDFDHRETDPTHLSHGCPAPNGHGENMSPDAKPPKKRKLKNMLEMSQQDCRIHGQGMEERGSIL